MCPSLVSHSSRHMYAHGICGHVGARSVTLAAHSHSYEVLHHLVPTRACVCACGQSMRSSVVAWSVHVGCKQTCLRMRLRLRVRVRACVVLLVCFGMWARVLVII